MSRRRKMLLGLGFGGGSTFRFTVKTDNTGTSADDEFACPIGSTGLPLNYFIDWGDGSAIENVTSIAQGSTAHVFLGGAGTYNITVTGDISGWAFDDNGDKEKIISVSEGGPYTITKGDAFYGCLNMDVTASDPITFDGSASLEFTFRGCSSMVSPVFNNWDTSTITSMGGCFRVIGSLPLLDISGWQVTQVTAFNNFLSGSELSTALYDKTLIAWAAQGTMSFSGTMNFGDSKYTSGGAAETARTDLIEEFGAISDGGPA